MRPPRSEPTRIVVIGGGITGLVAARELLSGAAKIGRSVDVVVLEAASRIGGKIRTEFVDGAAIETGPDSFVTLKPDALQLAKDLGLELIGTAPNPTVSVLKGGRLVPMPAGLQLVSPTRLLPFAFSPLFTMRGKLRMAAEAFIPSRRGESDESLADFTRRRLGDEALEFLVEPMLAGIYAGDVESLSVKSTFPQLIEMERRGGLTRGLWSAAAKHPPRKDGVTTFMTVAGGLSKLVDALVQALPPGTVRTDCPAQAVRRRGGRWEIATPRGPVTADAVIAAAPAPAFADAIESLDPELAERLRGIPFVSTATTTLIYDQSAVPSPPRGFGFLTVRSQRGTLNAATFSSAKFPGRSPAGKVVVRAFVGGAGRESAAEGSIAAIEGKVREELDTVLGLKGAAPVGAKTARWIKSNPQYNVGHSLRLERLASCLKTHAGLILAGCSYHGVGIPDCVRSGRKAAEMALAALTGRAHDTVRAGLV